MATTITIPFTVKAGGPTGSGRLTLTGLPTSGVGAIETNIDPNDPRPCVRAASLEFRQNGTTSGNVTVTAA